MDRLRPSNGMRRFIGALGAFALFAFCAGALAQSVGYIPAKLIKKVDPRPPNAGLMGFRGTVVQACFTITTEGKVKDIVFPQPDRQEFFDSSIRRALIRWRYEPATQDGTPVEQKGCAFIEIRAIGG